MINISLYYLLWHSLHQAHNWWDCECLHNPISVPAKWVQDVFPLRRKQLDLRERQVGARDCIAAPEMHRRASDIVRALDVGVQDVRNIDRRGLVGARLGKAVVLVDDDRVPNRIHVDVVEGHVRDGTRTALPRLDPDPVVRMLDHRIHHGDVRDAGVGVANAETANAARVKRKLIIGGK